MTSRPSARSSLSARKLPEHPDLDQLRRQAKELQQAFVAGDASAVAEVRARYRDADRATFALHDAQLVLARSYGFDSWPKLKARVDGVTAERLCDAVERGDVSAVRKMLRRRPEIVNLERPEHGEQRALHVAVLRRDAVMVRLLMEGGADARIGIWPNRDATSPLTIATERGYDDIVAIILEAEQRRPQATEDAIAHSSADATGALTEAVTHDRPDVLARLLEQGLDPDERVRVEGTDEIVYSWGKPLYQCARNGKLAMAEMLLKHGADPNGRVYASGSPTYVAYRRRDEAMIALLERYGGSVLDAESVGYLRHTEIARKMLTGEIDPRLELGSGETVAEQLLWSGASGGDAEIVRMSLPRIEWPREDPRWFWLLWRPLPGHWVRPEGERAAYLDCFRQILERCDPNVRAKPFGQSMLHEVVARDHEEGVGFATTLLDAGARTDVRDDLLESTPLGWACRWGRVALVNLLLEHGADPLEADAEPWATPRAWAEKTGDEGVLALLREHASPLR